MAVYTGAVYGPPSPELPEMAVILCGGEVVHAQAVRTIEEGEHFIQHMLLGLKNLAEKDAGDNA